MLKNLFGSQSAKRLALSSNTPQEQSEANVEPTQLVARHRQRLTAVRLESGFSSEEFERLVQAVVYQAAEYVHLIPASQTETHAEPGGLLRFAVETGCLAFRRADGKFLSGPVSTDIHNRARDRVWRYATFVAGLCRPLGRAAVNARVVAAESGEVWDPYREPIWCWMRRTTTRKLDIQWRDRSDSRPSQEAAIWIASRVITTASLSYLQSAGDHVFEEVLSVLAGRKHDRFGELIDAAYQAAIDQDLSNRTVTKADAVSGITLHHRLLEAIRSLVREKWTLNQPGGRLWHVTSGTFLSWRAAVTDIQIRLRALGVANAPSDPDTLAEVLVSQGLLTDNPAVTRGPKHYWKIAPEMRGIPKQGIEVVKIVDPELIGLDLSGVEPLEALPSSASATSRGDGKQGDQPCQEDLLEERSTEPSGAGTDAELPAVSHSFDKGAKTTRARVDGEKRTTSNASLAAPHATNGPVARSIAEPETPDLVVLQRYGAAGKALRAIALRCRNDPSFKVVHRHADGVALAYPGGLEPFVERPQDFLQDCEAHALLVSGKDGRRIHRARPGQDHLPEQYIVLSNRLGHFFSLS